MKEGSYNYNIDNKDNRNNIVSTPVSSIGEEADASEEIMGLAQGQKMSREGLPDPSEIRTATAFTQDEVRSAIIQFIDNGEEAVQRFKVKLRINLHPSGDVEFIAATSKRIQDFSKHVPGPNKQMIVDLAQGIRHDVKKKHNVWPYIGKFHLKVGNYRRNRAGVTNIEPDTFVAVWFNYQDQGWEGVFKFQDWETFFHLHQDRLTARQRQIGVKGQWVFKNPKYDTTVRPLTWAQRRQLGIPNTEWE